METVSEHSATFKKKEAAAGKISKGADSSKQPKQTMSILTDPVPRTG
jgi:hypothetical protein